MYDEKPHPLLVQVPLTVSPFVSLPTATTLPYTYKTLPSTLPPSSTEPLSSTPSRTINSADIKARYVIASTGHAAHPEDIIASCQSLQAHLNELQVTAEHTLEKWQQSIKEKELAEKRRLAPGWLDREEKILKPEKAIMSAPTGRTDSLKVWDGLQAPSPVESIHTTNHPKNDAGGQELDRAFGNLAVQ